MQLVTLYLAPDVNGYCLYLTLASLPKSIDDDDDADDDDDDDDQHNLCKPRVDGHNAVKMKIVTGLFRTGIGRPGKPVAPMVSFINTTFVNIQWNTDFQVGEAAKKNPLLVAVPLSAKLRGLFAVGTFYYFFFVLKWRILNRF